MQEITKVWYRHGGTRVKKPVPEKTQMLNLYDKDFISTIISNLQELN